MAINQWPEQDRPRERLVREGAQALSNPELLAIFLRVGVRGKNAVELAQEMLEHFGGSLQRLFHSSLDEFSAVNGLGLAKYAQLQAVLELARRAFNEQFARESLCSPDAVKTYLRSKFGCQPHESFVVLFLDVKNRLIDTQEMFTGTLTHTSVYPREVVKAALRRNAAGVMLAHNHPSGVCEPSDADLRLTNALVQALALIDVRVLDHFVVAGSHVHSFAENGQL
ncbi:RadC family protein [Massilia horti]|uniref:JAB domain-containing protein n=1 Tax=Massilia horti TaxID=2562153 RepID=A0A4Y9T0R3_9BURK|nr:DNA repair protein RadC [Massilia horti]TFW30493.1 JAB domain-containing protein [Massilia horti]TFW30588.1 JAB domain-containing protein [Massilia horti]